jgi:hypothetical protein
MRIVRRLFLGNSRPESHKPPGHQQVERVSSAGPIRTEAATTNFRRY